MDGVVELEHEIRQANIMRKKVSSSPYVQSVFLGRPCAYTGDPPTRLVCRIPLTSLPLPLPLPLSSALDIRPERPVG